MQKKSSTGKLSKWTEVSRDQSLPIMSYRPYSMSYTPHSTSHTAQSLSYMQGSIVYTSQCIHKGCVLEAKLIVTLIGAHDVQLSQYDQGTAA